MPSAREVDILVARYQQAGAPRLPNPRAELWEWQLHAKCRSTDPALFFPETGVRGNRLRAHEERAKEVCRACPVLRNCRHYAMTVSEPYGIWGAMTSRERALSSFGLSIGEHPGSSHSDRYFANDDVRQ